MLTILIALAVLSLILLLIPKFTTGRILNVESFVPEFQAYHKIINKDLRSIPIKIEIINRKLYKVKAFTLLKPVFELLPSTYTVHPTKNGLFFFWAYPFDVVNIIIGEDEFRETYTLRHKIKGFTPKHIKLANALLHLFFPIMLHEECIEIPSTLGKICGYADKMSAMTGEATNIMVSTKAESFSLELIRVGEKLQTIEEKTDIPGMYQNIETKFPSTLGCCWITSLRYKLPEGMLSGCYIVSLKGNGSSDNSFIPIIIKPVKVENRVAVIASTNTWHAYNSWGGQNFYINYTSYPSKYTLCMQRPFDLHIRNPLTENCEKTRDHLLVGERFVWSWLEREGFSYDMYSDIDLHSREVFSSHLSKYKIIVISTHSEYWSYEMIDHLRDFIKNGGRVLSLSGNTMFKEVTFPREDLMALDGAYFKYQGFQEESILGITHDLRGFKTWEPYKVLTSDHWVFDNTDLNNGDLIGKKGLNVSEHNRSGASGWETDKISPDSPENTTLLARGINSGGGGADMTLYQNSGGGKVFAVGSITYGGSLLVDDNISQITKNVIHDFLNN